MNAQPTDVNSEAPASHSNALLVHGSSSGSTNHASAVRIATPADLAFVLDLQRRFAAQLGFLPTVAIETYISTGRVKISLENNEPAGYLLGNPRLRCARHVTPLTHTAICYDAQRRELGQQLVQAAEAEASANGQSLLQCWCRVDLEANHFWSALGFSAVAIRRPDTTRALPLILWRKPLNVHGQKTLLHIPKQAGYRAISDDPRRLLTALERRQFLSDIANLR